MAKLSKIIITLLAIFTVLLISFNSVKAVDLNLTENISSNNSLTNSVNDDEDLNNTNYSNSTNIASENNSTKVTSVVPESNLGLTNILNFVLITIGILLILLAIAILIKLNK